MHCRSAGNLERTTTARASAVKTARNVAAPRLPLPVPKSAIQSLYAADSPLASSADEMDDDTDDYDPKDLLEYPRAPYLPDTFDCQDVHCDSCYALH